MNDINDLFELISKDLGLSIGIHGSEKCLDLLPDSVADFYKHADGVDLPFVEIYPVDKIRKNLIGDWSCFGFDGYFGYCLVNADGKIDLWDHESDSDPTPSFDSVFDLLSFLCKERVEDSLSVAVVVVSCFPETVSKQKIIKELKSVTGHSSIELLNMLKNLPVHIKCESRSSAIKSVRSLRSLGISCHVSI